MDKELSIVVLHYNKIRLTQRCIQSILDAGYIAEQIFCFDNGSQPEVFRQLQQDFPSCQHKRLEENKGFSGGFNHALEWTFSTGVSSTLFCTNDTLISSGAVEACLRTSINTGAGMVAPLITILNKPGMIDSIAAYFDTSSGTLFHYQQKGLPEILDPQKDYIPGTAFWINRDTFRELGGAEESYFMFWEDVDLCFRAHKKNIPLARCYQASIQHGGGQTTRKKPLYTTFYFQRNRIRFCKKYLNSENREYILENIKQSLLDSGSLWKQKGDNQRLEYLEQLLAEF